MVNCSPCSKNKENNPKEKNDLLGKFFQILTFRTPSITVNPAHKPYKRQEKKTNNIHFLGIAFIHCEFFLSIWIHMFYAFSHQMSLVIKKLILSESDPNVPNQINLN